MRNEGQGNLLFVFYEGLGREAEAWYNDGGGEGMQAIQHYLTIDLLRQSYDQKIYIHNGAVGHRLTVILTQGGKVIDLPDAEHGIVQLVYQKPDGTKSDVEMTVTGKAASVMIPRAATDSVGEVDCEVRVYTTNAEGTWTTTPRFTLDVENVIYDEDAQQEIESEPTVYESILSSEASRVLTENGRTDAEAARALAEEARAAAEAARVLAEEARAAAEAARIAAGAITRADVDATLSGTSVNPVQNKTIKDALNGKQDALTFDTEPTEGSPRPVKSGGIYTALAGKQGTLTFDETPTADSANPVKSGGVYTALDGKQDALTFDTEPILGSPRPVKSGGIYTALQGKQETLTFDDTPTQDSNNPVKSGGIYTAIQNMTPSVITGSFTLRFTEKSGSYSFVKQIGNVVYIYGVIQSTGTLADASSHHLGDITGVDGPARAINLPVWTTSDGEIWTPGNISLTEISGSIYVGMGVKETDSSMLINAFYTV